MQKIVQFSNSSILKTKLYTITIHYNKPQNEIFATDGPVCWHVDLIDDDAKGIHCWLPCQKPSDTLFQSYIFALQLYEKDKHWVSSAVEWHFIKYCIFKL